MPHPTYLFIIGHDALAAITDEEVAATVADLKELDLYRLPYDRVAVRLQTDDCILPENFQPDVHGLNPRFNWWQDKDGRWHSKMGPAHFVEFRNLNLKGEPAPMWVVHDGSDPGWQRYEFQDRGDIAVGMAERVINILITLLATRNAVKTTEHNKAARLGIGGKKKGSTKRYEYVTSISVPKILEDDEEHASSGKEKVPHLRRGHIRRQHYGPKNSMVKRKFIEAVFVNADKDWVATRTAYNVTRP